MLALREIHKTYGETTAVDEVSLTASAGETVSLIGPSGCGKSTLLRIAIGLVTPDRGEVVFDGAAVHGIEKWREIRRRTGYVIQEGGLFPHLTAFQNASLPAEHAGWDKQRCKTRVHELAELCRLPESLLDRPPGELSGGQRQRVALMRALMLDPDVLLLDEPLGALDPIVRYELQEELKALFDRLNKAVLVVTHDLSEACFLGHRVALMRSGKVIQEGPPHDLFDQPANDFVRQFVTAQRGHLEGASS